jgi:RNA polymerase sigma factor (sigma-70 family)
LPSRVHSAIIRALQLTTNRSVRSGVDGASPELHAVSQNHLYTTHARVIDEVITVICRRARLPPDRCEEYTSLVRLKLLADDCEVLRRFRGGSTIRTYLVTVLQRVLLDWRVQQWGKWRPSSAARHLGPVAIELERLLVRDRRTFDDAAHLLVARGDAASREELEAIRNGLPDRSGRWEVGPEVLENAPASWGGADATLVDQDAQRLAVRALAALHEALAALSPRDQLIIRLNFWDGVSVARIATMVGEDQPGLYRRLQRLRNGLRDEIVKRNVAPEDVLHIIGNPAVDFGGVERGQESENRETSPSTGRTGEGGNHA